MDARLKEILSGNALPTIEEVDEWLKKYPCFIVPALSLLRTENTDISTEKRRELASRVAISLRNRNAVSDILGKDAESFAEFYPQPVEPELTTNDTIDSFLEKFGSNDRRETDALTKMIFNPMPDYASVLAAEEKSSLPSEKELDGDEVDENDLLINRFIAKSKSSAATAPLGKTEMPEQKPKSEKSTNTSAKVNPPANDTENQSLTESFAKVMIKNGNYSKALEIITDLSLKNPEKSIYFADQIRFLKKLIINKNIK